MNRINVHKTYKLYINGKFTRSESGRCFEIKSSDDILIANVCLASRKDFRNSVVAARKAQCAWSGKTAYNRGQILYRIGEMMEGRKEQFVSELMAVGIAKKIAEKEVEASIDRMIYYAGWSDKYQQLFSTVNPVSSRHFNFSIPEPTGVVTLIAPESNPLLGFVSLIAPVIVSGNSCVILASHKNPLAAITLAEVIHSSDVPSGVINILTGDSNELAPHIGTHMDVNAVVYAGEDKKLGIQLKEDAAVNVKRVIIRSSVNWEKPEGESPYFILDTVEIKTTWHPVGI